MRQAIATAFAPPPLAHARLAPQSIAPKRKVHRRKPWSLGERLRNLTPDFMDVRRRNCSIARHFRH
ncbi:hypothetical protein FKO59_07330 [Burkholderia pseudomallei]|nr:hypothetical protein FKO42_07335 [Burkholderia pseudomallei]QDH40049.1 hypothetical protein FKO59_07330 [Burkholderia pseudomallei]